MQTLIKKLPLPIAGLMLGLASLGNLVGRYNLTAKYFIGFIAFIVAVLITIKIITIPTSLKETFNNPVAGSVMAAYPMGLMLLSTYIKPYLSSTATLVWYIALTIHVLFIIVFTKKYILKFNIKRVFPSYFVMYVGIVCVSVTSSAYGMQSLGTIVFWFGLSSYLVLLPIVLYRVIKVKSIPAPAVPTLIIFAAPASLLLAGYLKSFANKNTMIVYCLAALALVMVIYTLMKMPKMFKLPFVPAYSAFTFPFVISAIASTGFNNFMTVSNKTNTLYPIIQNSLTLFAIVIVFYVLIRYTVFLIAIPQVTKNNDFI